MSCSLACRLALSAADVEHDLVIVRSPVGETKQEPFVSINPLGQVPVLECDGATLVQTIAILAFIADRTGQGWKRVSALDRAKTLSLMALVSAELHGAWTMINRPYRFVDSEAGRTELIDHAFVRLDAAYLEVERQLGLRDDSTELGILDYYLCVFAFWKAMLQTAGRLSTTPCLDALKQQVMSSPKLRQLIEEDIAHYTALVS